ncbi:MAG: hypothetical protein HC848_09765 [Limnobacter sp.]|nr:hypothetical protein [Limnobacter sp.]
MLGRQSLAWKGSAAEQAELLEEADDPLSVCQVETQEEADDPLGVYRVKTEEEAALDWEKRLQRL